MVKNVALSAFQNLNWRMDEPLNKIRVFSKKNGQAISIKDILKKKVAVNPGDRIVILWHCRCSCGKNNTNKEYPVLSEPIRGKTVGSVMRSLERGVNRPLSPGSRTNGFYFERRQKYPTPTKSEVIYSRIANYIHPEARLNLTKKYESGKLKPAELYGDHIYFEGITKKGKFLYVHIGS